MRSRALVIVAALGLLALAACNSSGETAATKGPVETTTVRAVKSYRFSPADIKVTAGATVTWSNDDNFVHNVHLLDGSNATKDLSVGGTATITFDKPGLVRYECSLHPAQMKGSVLVE